MSIENLTIERETLDKPVLSELELASSLGSTVFEALAIDEKDAFETPDIEIDPRIMSSVTRLGDGQTVPDER